MEQVIEFEEILGEAVLIRGKRDTVVGLDLNAPPHTHAFGVKPDEISVDDVADKLGRIDVPRVGDMDATQIIPAVG